MSEKTGIQGMLTKYLPGYKGYLEENSRRDEDKQIRELISKKIDEGISNLEATKLEMVNCLKLAMMGKIDTPISKLMKNRDKIRFATYGYTGWFSEKTIDVAKLEEIQGYDKSLYNDVENILGLCEDIKDSIDSDDEMKDLFKELNTSISNLNSAISARDDMMKE